MAERQGLLVVFTGDGKGKTTAALGLAVRALGSGLRTTILQFVKAGETGEHRALSQVAPGQIEILRLGTGLVFNKPASAEARSAARAALETVRARLTGGQFDIVVVDEIFPALAAELVSEQEILELADLRPPGVHLVLTGRGAPPSVIERADLVTEMRLVKHPFARGIKAQAGIEL